MVYGKIIWQARGCREKLSLGRLPKSRTQSHQRPAVWGRLFSQWPTEKVPKTLTGAGSSLLLLALTHVGCTKFMSCVNALFFCPSSACLSRLQALLAVTRKSTGLQGKKKSWQIKQIAYPCETSALTKVLRELQSGLAWSEEGHPLLYSARRASIPSQMVVLVL